MRHFPTLAGMLHSHRYSHRCATEWNVVDGDLASSSKDFNTLTRTANVSFAEEDTARGETPESFVQQVRMVTRGRMIPFKVLTALAGYKWEIFVAEVDGAVVGCGGFLGRKKMELANLMVHPD